MSQVKYIAVTESDAAQLVVLSKVIAEGRFDVRGDAILAVGASLRHLAGLVDRVKHAQPMVVPSMQASDTPPATPVEPRKKDKKK